MGMPWWLVALIISIVLPVWYLEFQDWSGDWNFGGIFWFPIAIIIFLLTWLVYFIVF
jgi:hypothetical protein